MKSYQFTPQALDDLFSIWNFIAKDNPAAADRVEDAIFRSCEFLVDNPHAGRTRKDMTALPVRFWVVQAYKNYLVVYVPDSSPLQIIRIVHAARDLPIVLR